MGRNTILKMPLLKDNLIHFKNEIDELCKNVYSIALQAILGENILLLYKNNNAYTGVIPLYVDLEDVNFLPDMLAIYAIDFIKNKYQFYPRNNSIFWTNDYEVFFDGRKILSKDWVSSFSQAYAIEALLYWYKLTQDETYLDLAIKAAKFYLVPIEKGGFTHSIKSGSDTFIFFEEIPTNMPTHILNAHLISLISLIDLKKYYEANWLTSLIERGLKSTIKFLPIYDTEEWSRYDINHTLSSMFRIGVNNIKFVYIEHINIKIGKKILNMDFENLSFNTKDKFFISGIDWGELKEIEGTSVRKLINGKFIRKHPVEGGTLQNTYIYFHIDNIQENLINNDNVEVEIKLFSPFEEGEIYFDIKSSRFDDRLEFRNLYKSTLNKGWNKIAFKFPIKIISTPLSDKYHKFHIDLLRALYNRTKNEEIKKFLQTFEDYKLSKEFIYYQKYLKNNVNKVDVAFVSVNSSCGLACVMCDIGIQDDESSLYKSLKSSDNETMDIQTFGTLLMSLENRVDTISFIGTEPLFNKYIFDMIKLAKSKGFKVSLTTNGVNLKYKIEQILNTGLDELWISVDGLFQMHDSIRKKKGLFRRIEEALFSFSYLKEKKNKKLPYLGISYTIIPTVNESYLIEFLEYIKRYNIDAVIFNHLNFVKKEIAEEHIRKHPELFISYSKYIENFDFEEVNYLKFWQEILKININKEKYNFIVNFVPNITDLQDLINYYKYPDIKLGKKMCIAPWNSIQIDPNANVTIAARCFQLNMGNLLKNSFDEIWHGDAYSRFRELLLENNTFLPCLRCCGNF